MSGCFKISEQPLDESAISLSVAGPASGGIVTFVGRVRDNARGRQILRLEYEAYAAMAESVFAEIAREAQTRYEIAGIAIHHRIGVLEVGEPSVVIAVSAPHRGPAFDACRFVIDLLKRRAPIWKKEYSADGAVWIDERP